MKTPETQEDPDDPEPVGEGISNRNTLCLLYSPSLQALRKVSYKKLGQFRYHQVIWNIW